MAKNIGKIFEHDFSRCIPDYVAVLRIPDSAQSFNRTALRFSIRNPFDYLMWNSKTSTLYALELKTVKGKSISFERSKEDNGEIHLHQIQGLEKLDKFSGIVAGFIIEFREVPLTIFLPISEFIRLQNETSKKSFNIKDLSDNHIDYSTIPQTLIKTHYRYDVETFLKNTALHSCDGGSDEI